MLLRELKIYNLGPFAPEPIRFNPSVTVLTGTNDAGKSSLLNLIEAAFSTSKDEVINERDVNFDYLSECATRWTEDPKFVIEAELSDGEENASVKIYLRRNHWQNKSRFANPNGTVALREKLGELPTVIMVKPGQDEGIRQTINLANLNRTEHRLMKAAFGPQFDSEAIRDLSDFSFQNTVARAENELNRRLNAFLPPSFSYKFRFSTFSDKRLELNVSLVDANDATTGLTHRGRGIQILVDLLGSLAVENLAAKSVLLLIDEPETHLHADAQHSLRGALERLGDGPSVQVVYVTHSPSMINTLRPDSIRLVKREKRGDRVFSVIENAPYADGFQAVRSSLGLTPADSLLYAPVTILVEGKTEALCLPILLPKLAEQIEDAEQLLSQCIIVEVTGAANLDNFCRIAKAQGSKVIAFIDGDRADRWATVLAKNHPEVPVLVSVPNGEFEQLIAVDEYFDALRAICRDDRISAETWQTWNDSITLPSHPSFTKRVDRWLTDELNLRELNKPQTMYQACKSNAKIDTTSLMQLLAKVRDVLDPPIRE